MEKFILEGKLHWETFGKGAVYYFDDTYIDSHIYDYIYSNVIWAGNESVKKYRITIEEID